MQTGSEGGTLLIIGGTDYTLQILRVLTGDNRLITSELAVNEQIPQQLVYKTLKKLRKAGFVQVAYGTGDGCILDTGLSSVMLFQLIRAMERDATISAYTVPSYECQWWCAHRDKTCKAYIHSVQVQQVINCEPDPHALKDILFGS